MGTLVFLVCKPIWCLRWSHNCGGSTSSNLECLKLRNRRCWGKKITSVILWPCHGLTWGQPGKNILKEPWNTLKYPEAESILAYLKVVYSGISHIHPDSSSHLPPLSPTISHEFPMILAIHIPFMSYQCAITYYPTNAPFSPINIPFISRSYSTKGTCIKKTYSYPMNVPVLLIHIPSMFILIHSNSPFICSF